MLNNLTKILIMFGVMGYRGRCEPQSTSAFFASGSSSQNGVSHSSVVGADGVTRGECAFLDRDGREVKIRYEEYGDDIRILYTNGNMEDAREDVYQCRRYAQQQHAQTQQNAQALHEQIREQQNRVSFDIQRQQQALRQQHQNLFGMNNFIMPGFPFMPNFNF